MTNFRWTIKQLNSISDIDFAVAILNEKRNQLTNPYAPLSQKIEKTIRTLERLR